MCFSVVLEEIIFLSGERSLPYRLPNLDGFTKCFVLHAHCAGSFLNRGILYAGNRLFFNC